LIITLFLPVHLASHSAFSRLAVHGGDGPALLGERDLRNRETAAELIKAGLMRDRFLLDFRLGDPVWNILLDLYVAEKRGKRVSTSSLGIAAAVPRSTAQRCIAALVREAKLVRYPDEGDARRYWIALSPDSRLTLDSYFDGVRAELSRAAPTSGSGQVHSRLNARTAPTMGQSSLAENGISHKAATAG
jgi:DNA-binding MarR family transcriptional regulator